jgi:hypothetical protein
MILVGNGKGFGFLMKGHCIELFKGCAPKGNPFAETGLNVKKTETRLSVQVEIPSELNFFRVIFLFIWFLG